MKVLNWRPYLLSICRAFHAPISSKSQSKPYWADRDWFGIPPPRSPCWREMANAGSTSPAPRSWIPSNRRGAAEVRFADEDSAVVSARGFGHGRQYPQSFALPRRGWKCSNGRSLHSRLIRSRLTDIARKQPTTLGIQVAVSALSRGIYPNCFFACSRSTQRYLLSDTPKQISKQG